MGIVYLIQPCELVGTNRYKLGCSESPTLERVKNGYKKGTHIICVIQTDDPYDTESALLDEFKKKFPKIAGNEYFEGDIKQMKELFLMIIKLELRDVKLPNDIYNDNLTYAGNHRMGGDSTRCKTCKQWKTYACEDIYVCMNGCAEQ